MKFTLVYVIALVTLSVNEVLSKPIRLNSTTDGIFKPKSTSGEVLKPKTAPKGTLKPTLASGGEAAPKSFGAFDDYCAGKKLSDGTQIPEGSCSEFIQGDIPSNQKMPSTLIINPPNAGQLTASTAFNVDILVNNLATGKFSDPEKEYNNSPQSLDGDGVILGHTHITIQTLPDNNTPPDSATFAFFKGVNDQADPQGKLTVPVVDGNGNPGLPAGNYRICTMSGSFSHQPVVMPVAKRGAQDDCIRVNIK